MKAIQAWKVKAYHFDRIGATYKGLETGRFLPEFLQTANIEETVSMKEHQTVLLMSLQQIRYSIEKALIKYAQRKNMMVSLAYVRDLNTVHNLIWKVSQDMKIKK